MALKSNAKELTMTNKILINNKYLLGDLKFNGSRSNKMKTAFNVNMADRSNLKP